MSPRASKLCPDCARLVTLIVETDFTGIDGRDLQTPSSDSHRFPNSKVETHYSRYDTEHPGAVPPRSWYDQHVKILYTGDYTFTHIWQLGKSYDDVQNASDAGCHLCLQIVALLSQEEESWKKARFELTLGRRKSDRKPGLPQMFSKVSRVQIFAQFLPLRSSKTK